MIICIAKESGKATYMYARRNEPSYIHTHVRELLFARQFSSRLSSLLTTYTACFWILLYLEERILARFASPHTPDSSPSLLSPIRFYRIRKTTHGATTFQIEYLKLIVYVITHPLKF